MIPHWQSIGGQFSKIPLKTLLATTDQPPFIANHVNPIPHSPPPSKGASLRNTWDMFQFIWLTVCQSTVPNKLLCFDLFDSLKYLITLRSNIPPCQKATTLIWMPLSNPSLHLWKSLKNFLGTTIFLSWLPFEICDCDRLLNYECHTILAVSGHLSK